MSTTAVSAKIAEADVSVKKITDSVLLGFHANDKTTFEQLEKELSEVSGAYSDSHEKAVNEFLFDVRTYRTSLQDQKTILPTLTQLKSQEQATLNQYWDLVAACKRIETVVNIVLGKLSLLSEDRYIPKKNVKLDQTYLEELKVLREYSLNCTSKLTKLCGTVTEQRTRMLKTLDGEVVTNVNRFCIIVANNGKPLGFFQNTYNKMVNAPVPEANPRSANAYPIGKYPRLCSKELYQSMGIVRPEAYSGEESSSSSSLEDDPKLKAPVNSTSELKQEQPHIPLNASGGRVITQGGPEKPQSPVVMVQPQLPVQQGIEKQTQSPTLPNNNNSVGQQPVVQPNLEGQKTEKPVEGNVVTTATTPTSEGRAAEQLQPPIQPNNNNLVGQPVVQPKSDGLGTGEDNPSTNLTPVPPKSDAKDPGVTSAEKGATPEEINAAKVQAADAEKKS